MSFAYNGVTSKKMSSGKLGIFLSHIFDNQDLWDSGAKRSLFLFLSSIGQYHIPSSNHKTKQEQKEAHVCAKTPVQDGDFYVM